MQKLRLQYIKAPIYSFKWELLFALISVLIIIIAMVITIVYIFFSQYLLICDFTPPNTLF